MEAYKIISEEVKECPFCGGTKILYSVSKANAIDAYYGQCYCDNCKACGSRVRWVETSKGYKRYGAEENIEYKKEAIYLWNKREVKARNTVVDLPYAQSEKWLEQNKDKILQAGIEGREIDFYIGGRLFTIREKAQ